MKTVYLSVAALALCAASFFGGFTVGRQQAAPTVQAPADPLSGKAFAVRYYPDDNTDQAKVNVAAMWNEDNERISFLDGSFTWEGGDNVKQGGYALNEGQLRLDTAVYQVQVLADGMILQEGGKWFKMRLTGE